MGSRTGRIRGILGWKSTGPFTRSESEALVLTEEAEGLGAEFGVSELFVRVVWRGMLD